MKTLNINLGDRSYPIYIGHNLLNDKEIFQRHAKAKTIAIVTNDIVAPLYLNILTQTLGKDKKIIPIILPDGESYKNLDTLNLIYDELLKNKAGRDVLLIALGGGVVGDICGFAAASFMRGVDFIQIPTTLLSQVDSSVGGKTGINHSLGKNMIGAFYQPKCVVADINLLNTLPQRELSAGLAEVIKYGLIRDLEFFNWLETYMKKLTNKDSASLIEAVERSCTNKAEVVEADELESDKNIRATLNLGHTFGHAIENEMGYGNWLHGEAVAIGMIMAAFMSKELGWLRTPEYLRIIQLIELAGLPITPPDISEKKFLDLMMSDKKTKGNQINLVLQTAIGEAMLTNEYDPEILSKTLTHNFS
ncbi:MAG: 3-dehydroquinate synthase [Methylophilaceae bacterium]|jgi:3-dehydroquinate synthase|nr:3-dehydroquinate synthase [Methylophilaceae bacterium]